MRSRTIYGITTGCLLLLGVFLVWASCSWYALVWAQARAAFPDAGARVLMVNMDLALRAKYLPEKFQHELAIRAVVVDKKETVLAIVYRDPSLISYPEGSRHLDSHHFFIRAIAWSEACKWIGAVVIGLALIQMLGLVAARSTDRKEKIIRR
ncbi:MAG: hypothetical protein WCK89_04425 [bacterium]